MINLPNLEKKVLEFWEKNNIFKKSLEKPSPRGDFVFFEGPPTANGRPGIHHVLARAFKDIIPRFKTMQGYFVGRKAGWDTHGLPVELEVEKKLGISGKPEIEKYGIERFNQECQLSVWKYKREWEEMTRRIGFWLDLEQPYITYENNYIETLWWILKKIWERKLLYEDYKVVPYCPRCGTSLSSHELALGYKEVDDPSIYIKFPVKDQPRTYLLAWTTTPWTLPGNVALAVKKDVDYVKARVGEEILILAKARLNVLEEGFEIEEVLRGKDLIGLEYKPLYQFVPLDKKAHYVAAADFVSLEEGTGIVHTAVMYGVDDFELGKELVLPKKHLVDLEGKFISEAGEWAGMFVKDADPKIIADLEKRGLIYRRETIRHTYPFCWRCSSPLLYYAKNSWFIRMTKVKKDLIKNNKKVNWIPGYIKEGRFGEWLEELKDWAISRERYWGTPLPIWFCSNQIGKFQITNSKSQTNSNDQSSKLQTCNNMVVVGSIKELEDLSGQKVDNLHRPGIDKIEIPCEKCGGRMKRVPYVIDCWFDSGSMPFAQWHYPFENEEKIDCGGIHLAPRRFRHFFGQDDKPLVCQFPADYIAEAIDQTRGWFYTLLAISTLLDKGIAYCNVISLGHILDEKGQKMSKSRGNVVDPREMVEKYGADAVRWHFYVMNQPGDPKRFSEKDLAVNARIFHTLMNVYSFWKLYVSDSIFRSPTSKGENVLDKWILAKLNLLIKEVTEGLEKYEITESARKICDFIEDLSIWYLRRSRNRFKGEDEQDKQSALVTLRDILGVAAKLLAPFTPFLAEELYRNSKWHGAPISSRVHDKVGTNGKWQESVHLEEWPEYDKKLIDWKLLKEMEQARKICELGHALRAEAGIKVRQTLSELQITNYELRGELILLIKEELNVKRVEVVEELPQGDSWVIKEEGKTREERGRQGRKREEKEEEEKERGRREEKERREERRKGGWRIALNIEITNELKKEGILREIIRQINSLRKKACLTIVDEVELFYDSQDKDVLEIIKQSEDQIKKEAILKSLTLGKRETKHKKEIAIDSAILWLGF